MLTSSMTERLNHQINLEFYSSNLYLQMSAWAASKGFEGAAEFLKLHAAEEMQHMQKLFDYVLETGGLPIIGQLDAPQTEYDNIREIFEITLAHEKEITAAINDLVATSFENKDFSTFNFLQWYVAEQHEEENLFQSIIDKLNLLGDDPKNLFFIDREIAKLIPNNNQSNTKTP
ncbi:MAG: non-heme ferritin [Gammaproteobacteria bacterium]|nr:non-heme ferritin [Gammaproteobacteria bacterium]